MNSDPLVSIVIPVYNGANFLAEAIDSALAQTYSNTEVLVINDGSTDEGKTKRIAESYGKRVRYFEKENGGVATALNLGIREMRGDYFSWLSHDDSYLPNKVSLQIDFLKCNPKYRVCYSGYLVVNDKGELLKKIRTPWYPREKAIQKLIGEGYINGCTLLIHRDCFSEVGVFNESLRYTQDVEMWIRILSRFNIGCVEEALVNERRHSLQGSSVTSKELDEEALRMYVDVFMSQNLFSLVYPKTKGKIDDDKKLALTYLWIANRIAKTRQNYRFSNELYHQSLLHWKSWRNAARVKVLIGAKNASVLYRIEKLAFRLVSKLRQI